MSDANCQDISPNGIRSPLKKDGVEYCGPGCNCDLASCPSDLTKSLFLVSSKTASNRHGDAIRNDARTFDNTISYEIAARAFDAARSQWQPSDCDFLGYRMSLPGPVLRAFYGDRHTGRVRVFGFDLYSGLVEVGDWDEDGDGS